MGACSSVPEPQCFWLDAAYKLQRRIARGGQADIWLGESLSDGKQYALKLIPRGMPHQLVEALVSEVQCGVAAAASSVACVPMHELLLTKTHLVIALPYVAGGTLESYCRRVKMDEMTARFLFRQLVSVLAYLHARGIAYRDVKPDNVVLSADVPPRAYLLDFGVAHRFTPHQTFNTLVGTPGYIGPQTLACLSEPKCHYDGPKEDVWGAGTALYVMLRHHLLFGFSDDASEFGVPEALERAAAKELHKSWRASPRVAAAFSRELVDLLDKMLEPDEAKRITMFGVLAHPWVATPLPPPMQAVMDAIGAEQAVRDETNPLARLHVTDAAIERLVLKAAAPAPRAARGILERLSLETVAQTPAL